MKLTTQQEATIQEVILGSTHIVNIARAGTGKTSTAAQAAHAYNNEFPAHAIGGMAFNKTISLTLADAVPFATVKTSNSFGFGAWMKRCGKNFNQMQVNRKKNADVARGVHGGDPQGFEDLLRAVSLCKAWGIVPKGAPAEAQGLYPDEPKTYVDLFRNYNIDTGNHPDPIGIIRQILLNSIFEGWKGIIDFDDQLYLPVIYRCNLIKFDLLILDEAQDLNPAQREMARMMLKPSGRLFALGDDRQAIYGFRGADRESLPNIIKEFNAKVLPLTVSFRCAKSVVRRAQLFVPDIEEFEGQIEGEVSNMKKPSLDLIADVHDVQGGAVILCRNNAPLVKLCLNFYREGIPATILGREIAQGLIRLVDKQKADSLSGLNSTLWNYISTLQEICRQKNRDEAAELLHDQGECLEVLISSELPNGTVSSLKQRIKSLFIEPEKARDEGILTLSTIHKCKGMEWTNVFILDPELMPSPYAKTPEEIEQENNLHYVAITRAKRNLIYIRTEDF